jgi:hypothetical protein
LQNKRVAKKKAARILQRDSRIRDEENKKRAGKKKWRKSATSVAYDKDKNTD